MIVYPDFSLYGYQVICRLGRNREGGRVSYLAYDKDLSKVVIKQFCFAQVNSSWRGFKTYQREIAILQTLQHPRVPRYLKSFETPDGFCMVQEYKPAPSLATKKSFQPQEIKQILVSVLEILVAIQDRLPPIIHRDIKPENILVDRYHKAYLIDFGLAKANNQESALSSIVAGTPGFTPPEELFNRPLTTASDLYSLGVTAIALITNTSSLNITNLIDENYQFQYRHLATNINADFGDWLNKMVAANVNQRYSDAMSALKALIPLQINAKAHSPQSHSRQTVIFAGISALITGSITAHLQPDTNLQPNHNIVKTNYPSLVSPSAQNSSCNLSQISSVSYRENSPKKIGYLASCHVLSDNLKLAENMIQQLPPHLRVYAAEVAFDQTYSLLNGEDKKLAAITDLAIRYGSNNYVALYHGGISAYRLNEFTKAKNYLQRFLDIYQFNDYWKNHALQIMKNMNNNTSANSRLLRDSIKQTK